MSAEVYSVYTRIAMQDSASAAVAALATRVLHLDTSINRLQGSLTGLSRTSMAVVGSLSALGGTAIIAGLIKVANHGDKLLDQQDKLQRAGMSYNEVLKAQADYYNKVAKSVPTATAADYLRTFNELRSVVGADTAQAKTPWALKLEALMANMSGKSAEGQGFKILRALEMKGITLSDPKGADKLAEMMMKDIIGSGGKLSASDYEQMAKTGGVAWIKAKPEFIAGPLSNIASDMGGSRTGTALMTLYQLMAGSVQVGKLQAGELEKLGLVKPGYLIENKGGDASGIKPGGIVGWETASQDPYKWVNEVVMPRMRAVYGDDEKAIEGSLAKIGRNRNAIRMLTMMSDPGFKEQMAKDFALWSQAKGIDPAYADYVGKNPQGVKAAFWGQYESMMQAIGAPMMQAAIPVMRSITELFTKISAWANANPAAITAYGEALATVGAGLFGAGTLSIVTAVAGFLGTGGAIIVGLSALYAGMKLLQTIDWPGFLSSFKGFGEAVIKLAGIAWNVIKVGFDALLGVLKIIPGVVSDAWTAMKPFVTWFGKEFAKGIIEGFQKIDTVAGKIANGLQALIGWFDKLAGAIGGLIDWIRNNLGSLPGMGWMGSGGSTGGSYSGSGVGPIEQENMRRFPPVGGGYHSFAGQSAVGRVGTGSSSDVKAVVDAAADRHGVNRSVMYGIVAGESAHGNRWDIGDGGRSFSPFQLYTGGGLGNVFQRQTGLSLRDPKNLPAIADFSARHIARTRNLGPWHGYHGPRNWNPLWGNMGYSPRSDGASRPGPGAHFKPPARSGGRPVQVATTINVDGRELARATSTHIARDLEHSRQAPYFNGQGMFAGPDTKFAVG